MVAGHEDRQVAPPAPEGSHARHAVPSPAQVAAQSADPMRHLSDGRRCRGHGPGHVGGQRPPFILPHDASLYAFLRRTHMVLAYLLFLTIFAHFGAILFHTLIVRDGMLFRMVPWNVRPREVVRGSDQPTSRSERVEV